jgi:hypothetical protein
VAEADVLAVDSPRARAKKRLNGFPAASLLSTLTRTAFVGVPKVGGDVKVAVSRSQNPNCTLDRLSAGSTFPLFSLAVDCAAEVAAV